MADLKISQLTAATALAGTEVVPVVQGGSTKKATIEQILSPAAGKGLNFAANANAPGMTSELLNWYEEGTFTPTITAGSGAFGTVSATATYTRVGRLVYIDFNILISGNGSAAGYIKLAGLPYNASSFRGYGNGAETDAVGFSILAQVIGSTDYVFITKADGTYPGADGYRLQGSLTYKV